MNSSISQTGNLFLPLSNLNTLCQKLHNSLTDPNVGQKERSNLEQSLWAKIKETRSLNSDSLLKHFIGFYAKILLSTPERPIIGSSFRYDILMRLGDLNRYIEELDVAEYYYCNARNLAPFYGHAYNQLGLLTDSSNIYKCCYYYARAAKSCERPLTNIADSNLRIAVNKFDCEILNHVLNEQTCLDIDDIDLTRQTPGGSPIRLPETASQWFYVVVVAIYADNVQSIIRLFLRYMSENYSTQRSTLVSSDSSKTTTVYCDLDSYLLLASHDILLDWLKLSAQGGSLLSLVSRELRKIRSSLQTTLLSMKYDIYDSSNDSSLGTSTKDLTTSSSKSTRADTTSSSSAMLCETVHDYIESFKPNISTSSPSEKTSRASPPQEEIALVHDYVLRGFKPLDEIHRQLSFPRDAKTFSKLRQIDQPTHEKTLDQRFIESNELRLLLSRIKCKTDALVPPVKKRMRNIALQSILTSAGANID